MPSLCDIPDMKKADYPYRIIGQRLVRLRKSLGYSQKEFSEMNNFGATQYTNWETGHRRIPVESAGKLVDRYGLSLDWIYLGRESTLPQNLMKSLASIPRDLK